MQQNEIFNQFFKKEAGLPDNKALLENIAKEHPYFGLAQYFLLKNTDPSANEYSAAAEKTALVFNDDYLLNALLNEKDHLPEAEIKEETAEAPEISAAAEEETSETVEVPAAAEEPPAEPAIMFEPLHASDYFASQGIKLSADMMGDDKLGKQLKSFTSWLKTMKKVHPDKMSETGKATDTAIQNIAEKSNREEEVLTEAMAEAYRLQGKNAKALDTYEKLSLLNPAKSAYFAAKIEFLKN